MPEIGHGDVYKYRITSQEGRTVDKADPFAFRAERGDGVCLASDTIHATIDVERGVVNLLEARKLVEQMKREAAKGGVVANPAERCLESLQPPSAL